jgi:hypothetical protein
VIGAWARLVWYAVGVAVISVAAQLGVADALGIIRWDEAFVGTAGSADAGGTAGTANAWNALLTWVAFIFVTSVLAGAAIGVRAVRRPNRRDGVTPRVVASLAAGVGGSAAVTLAWLPGRSAQAPLGVNSGLVLIMTAGAAIVVGVVLSLVILSAAPLAAGVRSAAAWVWLAGIGSAVIGALTHEPYAAPRLGVIDAPSLVPVTWWSGPNLMIAVAVVIGVAVAGVARWAGANRFAVALSGLAGPAVLASAYLIAGPGGTAERGVQFAPYQAALIAAAAGLVASVPVALPARRRDRVVTARPTSPAQPPPPAPVGAEPAVEEPTAVGDGLYRAKARPPAVIGRPPRSYDEDYSEWLKDLGGTPGRPANSERQTL